MNVKQITKYECGACGKEYSSLERAEECCMCSDEIKKEIKQQYDDILKWMPTTIYNINDYVRALYVYDELENLYWENSKYTTGLSHLISNTQDDVRKMCRCFVEEFVDDLCNNRNNVFSKLDKKITV